jgi:hypothetical protein
VCARESARKRERWIPAGGACVIERERQRERERWKPRGGACVRERQKEREREIERERGENLEAKRPLLCCNFFVHSPTHDLPEMR